MNQIDRVIFEKVSDIVANTFRMNSGQLSPDSSLKKLPGWDSLSHIGLMMEIEHAFGIRIPTDRINAPETVGDIALLVAEVTDSSAGSGSAFTPH